MLVGRGRRLWLCVPRPRRPRVDLIDPPDGTACPMAVLAAWAAGGT